MKKFLSFTQRETTENLRKIFESNIRDCIKVLDRIDSFDNLVSEKVVEGRIDELFSHGLSGSSIPLTTIPLMASLLSSSPFASIDEFIGSTGRDLRPLWDDIQRRAKQLTDSTKESVSKLTLLDDTPNTYLKDAYLKVDGTGVKLEYSTTLASEQKLTSVKDLPSSYSSKGSMLLSTVNGSLDYRSKDEVFPHKLIRVTQDFFLGDISLVNSTILFDSPINLTLTVELAKGGVMFTVVDETQQGGVLTVASIDPSMQVDQSKKVGQAGVRSVTYAYSQTNSTLFIVGSK